MLLEPLMKWWTYLVVVNIFSVPMGELNPSPRIQASIIITRPPWQLTVSSSPQIKPCPYVFWTGEGGGAGLMKIELWFQASLSHSACPWPVDFAVGQLDFHIPRPDWQVGHQYLFALESWFSFIKLNFGASGCASGRLVLSYTLETGPHDTLSLALSPVFIFRNDKIGESSCKTADKDNTLSCGVKLS